MILFVGGFILHFPWCLYLCQFFCLFNVLEFTYYIHTHTIVCNNNNNNIHLYVCFLIYVHLIYINFDLEILGNVFKVHVTQCFNVKREKNTHKNESKQYEKKNDKAEKNGKQLLRFIHTRHK